MSTTEKETIINGYRVELDLDGPDGTTQCFISKDRHSASLEALIYTGTLTAYVNGEEMRVPDNVILKIESWALAEGY